MLSLHSVLMTLHGRFIISVERLRFHAMRGVLRWSWYSIWSFANCRMSAFRAWSCFIKAMVTIILGVKILQHKVHTLSISNTLELHLLSPQKLAIEYSHYQYVVL